ncbi:hypothetical protein B0H15DRAFT_942023 [Mycena belliarum]|uniref:Ribonuclease H1 N-terminal domain-containing protein n=1 Tax=Mycena belliarum TaxID=1033014 RepID=A0AAD6UK43_9AGAR|nr:hypothetical protein B0H15DRAFT_942023 [Mycena belliae]
MPSDSSDEYDDADVIALISALHLSDDATPLPAPLTPPRTPSTRPPPPYSASEDSFDRPPPRTPTTVTTTTLYRYESPTKQGTTTDWSVAAGATQGVPSAHVRALTRRGQKKPATKKVAYTVFCGRQCGVFLTWSETRPLVNRVPNVIFRGYASVPEAHAAYAYAVARSWTCVAGANVTHAIPRLPRPAPSVEADNPLNGSETLDPRWYIVYKGIQPGVYRSHLECQLNTLGVQKAVHESIAPESEARRLFAAAVRQGDVETLLSVYSDNADPFI